jgi:hypothetical protein
MPAKLLNLDIETAPIKGVVWSLWNNNLSIDHIDTDWYILTYAAKWLDGEDVLYDALTRYPEEYKADPENDYHLLCTLRDLLDEADIVIGHNARKFDVKKINARFLKHGILPPSPYETIDTLEVARQNFALTSNKLEYLARTLGLKGKNHTDIDLWKNCGKGVKSAWKTMIEYNIQDVILLEQVYYKLRPWMNRHPNLALFEADGVPRCPKCGGTHLHYRGYVYTQSNVFRRFKCQECDGWGRERYSALDGNQKKGIMTNANSNN